MTDEFELQPGDVCITTHPVFNCDEFRNGDPYAYRPPTILIPAHSDTLFMIVCDGDLVGYGGQWIIMCSRGLGCVFKLPIRGMRINERA
jgi:hypothetical protein